MTYYHTTTNKYLNISNLKTKLSSNVILVVISSNVIQNIKIIRLLPLFIYNSINCTA